MYGKDLVKKNTRGGSSGTRQLLGKIAQQNVATFNNLGTKARCNNCPLNLKFTIKIHFLR